MLQSRRGIDPSSTRRRIVGRFVYIIQAFFELRKSEEGDADMPFIDTQAADAAIHAWSIRLARQCRHIIQACLREEEWGDADREFYRVIRQGLEDFKAKEKP